MKLKVEEHMVGSAFRCFFFREKYAEGCTGMRKKRTMQRKQKKRRENRSLFARPCVCTEDARFLPTPYASRGAHVLS